MKKVYLIAIVLLLIGMGGQAYSLYLTWALLNVGGKISAFANLGFNIIIILIFYNIYKLTPSLKSNSWENKVKDKFDEMFEGKREVIK